MEGIRSLSSHANVRLSRENIRAGRKNRRINSKCSSGASLSRRMIAWTLGENQDQPPRVTDNEPHPPALEAREDISRHTYIENDDGLRQNEA